MDYKKEREIIPTILELAYKECIKDAFDTQTYKSYKKGENDVVTDCDMAVEEFLLERIGAIFPEDTFISEETNADKSLEERTWVIDPIDGTVNFSRGISLYGIQVALVVKREPVFSCIYIPQVEEMYVAVKGQGAYLNGKKIQTSHRNTLFDSIISFGDYPVSAEREEDMMEEKAVVEKTYSKVKKVKFVGAACVDFSYVASGKIEAYILFTKNLWDILPGYLLATEAGGVGNYDIDAPKNKVVIAANQEIFDALNQEVFESIDKVNS